MSAIGKRLAFQNAKNAITRAGLNPGAAVLSQSYLRFEAPLSTTTATYTFDVLVNENTNPNNVTQQKLALQDAFVISELGIYLATSDGTTGDTKPKLYSYPSPTVFTTTTSAAAYTLYNGMLQLTVNQRTIVTAWDAYRHLYVPQTQNVVNATGGTAPQDQFEGNHAAMYPVEPNITLVGSKKNLLQLVLPGAISSVLSNSRVVVIARGILAQNVTPVN